MDGPSGSGKSERVRGAVAAELGVRYLTPAPVPRDDLVDAARGGHHQSKRRPGRSRPRRDKHVAVKRPTGHGRSRSTVERGWTSPGSIRSREVTGRGQVRSGGRWPACARRPWSACTGDHRTRAGCADDGWAGDRRQGRGHPAPWVAPEFAPVEGCTWDRAYGRMPGGRRAQRGWTPPGGGRPGRGHPRGADPRDQWTSTRAVGPGGGWPAPRTAVGWTHTPGLKPAGEVSMPCWRRWLTCRAGASGTVPTGRSVEGR